MSRAKVYSIPLQREVFTATLTAKASPGPDPSAASPQTQAYDY